MKIKMTKINEEKFNRRFNLFILGGMTLAMVATTAIQLAQGESGTVMLLVAAFGSLMGVLSTVFSANARILTFLFGFFDVTIYGVMCLMSHNYGNGALHLVYFLPMQFIGFWQWRRRGAGSHDRPKARRLGGSGRVLSSIAFLAGLAVCYCILWKVSGSASPVDGSGAVKVLKLGILADAFSTVCNIFGQLLMSMAYMEQWVFWIGVNVASVAMWTVTLASGDEADSYALIYLLKYAFYLLNSLNGLRIWLNLSRPGGGEPVREKTGS